MKQRSLRTTILWLFIPFNIVFVLLSGYISYHFAAQQLEENAYTSISDTVSQTKYFLNDRLTAVLTEMTIFNNDYDYFALIRRLEDSQYVLQPDDYINMNRILDKIYTNHYSILDSIFVSLKQGKAVFIKEDYLSSQAQLNLNDYITQERVQGQSGFFWKNLHKKNVVNQSEKNNSVASLYKIFGKETAKMDGIILFQLRESFFKDILISPQISNNGYLALISPDGAMSFKSVKEKYRLNNEVLAKLRQSSSAMGKIEYVNDNNEKMLMIYDTIGLNKWKVVAIFPRSELLTKVAFIKYASFSAMFIVILIAIISSALLARIVTKPITKLTRMVNKIDEGNLDVTFDVHRNNEIGILNRGLHDLIVRVKDLLTQVENEQVKKRNAEFAVLQAQIQPHFLYNTLYSIKSLCDTSGADDAGKMVLALSNYFRISISKGSEIISIREELEHIKSYLYIQHMRYGDDFHYQIEIDSAVLEYSILKLTLQPIVENAIYHGVRKNWQPGHIQITGYLYGEDIFIQIQDDGAGMTPERLQELQDALNGMDSADSTFGFGVRNVHSRLILQYGLSYGITYDSSLGTGTTALIKISKQKHINR